jgi:hypothetical protein
MKVFALVIARDAKVLLLPEAPHLFPVFSGILHRVASGLPAAYPMKRHGYLLLVSDRKSSFFG